MASVLYQSIETLSRDKGIEPQMVVAAVEDAIALATRKYYKTQENMRAEMDKETGEIRAYVFKTVVEGPEQVEDEMNQIDAGSRRARWRRRLRWAASCASTRRPTCWGGLPRRWRSR